MNDVDDDEERRRRRRIGFVVLTVALLALAGAAVALFLLLNNDDNGQGVAEPTASAQTVAVPMLVGLTEEAASIEIEDAGLTVGAITQAVSDEANLGLVIEQSPTAQAEVDEGATVDLVIGSGPDVVPVSLVVGLTEAQAKENLQDDGFQVLPSVPEESLVTAGVVLSVTPPEGTQVAPGTAVTLTISTGTIAIPDVRTQLADDAEQALRDLGFTNIQRTNVESDAPEGTVVEVTPVVGSQAAAGDLITLAVAVPIPPAETTTTTTPTTVTPSPLTGSNSAPGRKLNR